MIKWEELFNVTRGNCKTPERLLCLDPGETTGWALFEHHKLVRWGQVRTVENDKILWHNLDQLFLDTDPDFIICEDYRIYQHKLARHSFSPVLTLRLIGGIDLMATLGWYSVDNFKDEAYYEQHTCPIEYQMATQAKAFVTDEKLINWGFWQDGMRHSRDAIRHGCYFLLFHRRGEDII